MNKFQSKLFDCEYYEYVLDCGLKVYFCKKENMYRQKGEIVVNFGARNRLYKLDDVVYQTKSGIAHFIEHQLFNMPDGLDVMNAFTALEADCNAYTSSELTGYYYNTTNNYLDCLRLLISFVFTPYFKDDNINIERDIIIEESKSYVDEPEYVCDYGILKQIYKENYCRDDIIGKLEDLKVISSKDLYDAYNDFYIPNNMILLLSGNVDIDKTISLLKELEQEFNLKPKKLPHVMYPNEELNVYKSSGYKMFDIAKEIASIGYKIDTSVYDPSYTQEVLRYLGLFEILCFGNHTPFMKDLRKHEIINLNFYTTWCMEKDMGYFVVCGESDQGKLLLNKIDEEIKSYIGTSKITVKEFEHAKRIYKAHLLKSLSNYTYLASCIKDGFIYNFEACAFLDNIELLNIDSLQEIIKQSFLYKPTKFYLKPKNSKID